ncbi:hypothetical protein P3X46_015954 [Hevea brasiliensis]|uniref:AAA+ ATPase domain-containing protein n=1 Tax=Hevea brasiliensis TaxID=3981 RepID=A0ABQ9LXJ3_HEVBR|nr:AAA-ATPase At5g17760 isoform X2 [Hevea brasiliensis]KAJ9172744.1 hypothetical protein P3X46_015954 [Hevea brasiliensis]
MFSSKEMPSPSSLFSAYASIATSMMLFRSMVNEIIPYPIRSYLFSTFRFFFKPRSSLLTLVIDESTGIARNLVYDASETYLCTKVSPNTERLKISKTSREKNLTIKLEKGEQVVDFFDDIELKWRFVCTEPEKNDPNNHNPFLSRSEKRCFELSFHKKHKEKVLNYYVPYILEKSRKIKDEQRVLKMHTLNNSPSYGGIKWESINLDHPATFETLAMDPEAKKAVIEDLERFVSRKDFYKRVGRAWKRGYLLYGPPGTGKSSLVAAMANHLKFDVYDLQLANIMRDSDLRKLLLATGNKSILVIEDIDCSVDLPDRLLPDGRNNKQHDVQLTLSGLLNFIDGLWSSCGDERIIIFTTNHKERLDPALLRPGRMDMHIHMSYCTSHGFGKLASNYLGINSCHRLFAEIESLINNVEITPAQVAEELMKNEDADIALEGLVKLLKRKKFEGDEFKIQDSSKRQKIEKRRRKPVRTASRRITRRRYL